MASRAPGILLLGFWCGSLAGCGELGYLAARKYLRHLFVFRGADTLWMTPLATALLFVAAGALLLLVTHGRRRSLTSLAFGGYTFLTVLGLLFLIPPFHKGAAFALALGIGVQAGRLIRGREPLLSRLVRATAPVLVAGLLVTLLAVRGSRWWSERSALSALAPPRPEYPNVLLLVLDTVRAMNLSAYGYHRATTPTLERLAAGGARFDRALSTAPWTLPSHASLFTGTWPHEQATDWFLPLGMDEQTLAGTLSSAGYRSGGFVANTAYCSRETGLARGFAHYEDYPVTIGTFLTSASLIGTVVGFDAVRDLAGTDQLVGRKTAADVNSAFLKWADADRGRPFFAFINYYDAHTPYLPPGNRGRFQSDGIPLVANLERHKSRDGVWPPDQVQGAMDAYDGAIAYIDEEIGRLVEELSRRGMLDQTLIIVTSDHGEEFNEHGLIHHGNSLYRPAIQVPLILSWPGRIPAGVGVSQPVSLRDMPSTVVDLAGIGQPGAFPGASLARYWLGGAMPEEPLLSELKYAPQQPEWYPASKGPMFSAVSQGLRYIRSGDGRELLFDFNRDPGEQTDLSASAAFAGELARFRALMPPPESESGR